ncbi:hypothetical protein FGO68_gene12673 [Halteria grandinella]|uniref:Uncharacterized protein n=1 Tax=Halteria grandinella TaxID=5974 RepID=A0A8J8SX30_HALGN|nr:hypothetical protein FGO68_gene12673 [Halteria grandinella]
MRSKMIQQMLEEYEAERAKYQQEKFTEAQQRLKSFKEWFLIKRGESEERKREEEMEKEKKSAEDMQQKLRAKMAMKVWIEKHKQQKEQEKSEQETRDEEERQRLKQLEQEKEAKQKQADEAFKKWVKDKAQHNIYKTPTRGPSKPRRPMSAAVLRRQQSNRPTIAEKPSENEDDIIAIQIQDEGGIQKRSPSGSKRTLARQNAKNYDEFTPTSKNQFLQFTNQIQSTTGSSNAQQSAFKQQSSLSKVMSRL